MSYSYNCKVNPYYSSIISQPRLEEQASGQLLAGVMLVDGRQTLLVNCIELCNRKPSIDAHYERFGAKFMNDSTPSFTNKYYGVKTVSKINDRSRKFTVFNALVTPSLCLDKDNAAPEVDASAYMYLLGA